MPAAPERRIVGLRAPASGESWLTAMMRLFGWFLVLALIVLIPFLIWGSGFERSFSQEGTVAWLTGYGRWASVAGILLLMSDLVLPIPATAVMAALGFVYGPVAGGLIATLGSFLSGALAYLLCRRFGRPAAARLLGPQELVDAERLFARVGGWLVVLSRWLPVFPEVIACMAGLCADAAVAVLRRARLRLGAARLRVCRDRSCRRRPPGPGDHAQRRPAAAALAERPALVSREAAGAGRRKRRARAGSGRHDQEAHPATGRSGRAAALGASGDRGGSLSVPRDGGSGPAAAAAGLAGAHRRLHGLRRQSSGATTRPESSRPIPGSSSRISAPTTIRCGSPAGPRSSRTGPCSPRSGPRTRCCAIISARPRTPS